MSGSRLVDADAEWRVSTDELRRRLNDPGLTIVDVRPLPPTTAGAGRSAARGGHIPGAVALPARVAHRGRRRRGLSGCSRTRASRRAARSSSTATADEVSAVADAARRARPGTACASTTTAGPSGPPTRRLPRRAAAPLRAARPHRLALRSCSAAARRRPRRRAASCSSTSTSASRRSTPRATSPARSTSTRTGSRTRVDWNRRSPEELDAALRALGITQRHHRHPLRPRHRGRRRREVARTPGRPDRRHPRGADPALLPASTTSACSTAATTPGSRRATRSRRRSATPDLGAVVRRRRSPLRPELIVDIDEAKEILADPDGAALVSVRTWNEHIGKVSGYNYIGPAGRIAGDVWGNCGTDAYHMQHYRNVDNTMRAVPGDRGQLGGGRHHARQVGRLLLRHRLAGERDLVLRLPDGLAAHRRLRRRLVRVEQEPRREPDRGRRARRPEGRGRRLGPGPPESRRPSGPRDSGGPAFSPSKDAPRASRSRWTRRSERESAGPRGCRGR